VIGRPALEVPRICSGKDDQPANPYWLPGFCTVTVPVDEPVTVRLYVAWWLTAPVPFTITWYVPAGVVADVARVSVEELPDVTVDGEKEAVAPDGRPLADSCTDCGSPLLVVVPTVVWTELPGATDPEAGLSESEKSLPVGGASPTASFHSPYAAASALRSSTVEDTFDGYLSQAEW
jgi:hypothetical protein